MLSLNASRDLVDETNMSKEAKETMAYVRAKETAEAWKVERNGQFTLHPVRRGPPETVRGSSDWRVLYSKPESS
jgi:hypothetical protein